MRAVSCADAAMYADHRLVDLTIPVNSTDNAGILAIPATDAFRLIEANAASLTRQKRVGRADLEAGGILASAADNNDKAPFHAAGRFHPDAGFSEARLVLPQRTGKHADLTPNTSFSVQYH